MIVEKITHQAASWKKPAKDFCSIVDVVAVACFRNRVGRKKFSDRWTRPIKAVVHLIVGISTLLKARKWQDSVFALWDTGWAIWSLADWAGHPIKFPVKDSEGKEKDALKMLHFAKRLTAKWKKAPSLFYGKTLPKRMDGLSAAVSIMGKALEINPLKETSKIIGSLEVVVRRWHSLSALGR